MSLYSPVFPSPVSAIAQVAARRRTALQRTPLAHACVGLLLASWAATASAQQAPATQGEASPTALDTVTVTAEHREQNLQDVPVSVGVVQGAAMRDYTAGGDDMLLALSGRVPGFYAETTTGRIFPRFYIRGLGNIDFYLGASQPVSMRALVSSSWRIARASSSRVAGLIR
ncbi:hypothetical protein GW15_0205525 [Xanthomonas axonopodis pv. vasculorum]|uniref:TonB-dependent receptor plug domain-containing protein n=1 Tax=Xanthomonas axonopodis pv. vasculorum TaxID=325777 RepID=A0A098Q0M7_9XANT|nr:hypothetical protein GW15_0205525 [Xanthomonas axonopodis pv. vasculorum]